MEFMVAVTMLLTIFNFLMLYRLSGKRQTQNDSALYEEQIKTLKKVIRLNDKMLKSEKEKRDYEKSMEQSRTEEQKPGLVYPEIERRVY